MTPRPGRRVATVPPALVIGCVLAAVLAGSAITWAGARTSPQTVERTVHVEALGTPVPAGDCPDDLACEMGSAPAAARAAVARWFSSARVFDDFAQRDFSGHVVYFVLRARTPTGITISVSGRCVRGGMPVADVRADWATRGPALVWTVAAAGPGCSSAVLVAVPDNVSVPATAIDALAHDDAIRLPG